MNQPATKPTLTSLAEPMARPKVLRRPTTFARATQPAEILPLTEVRIDYIPTAAAPEPSPAAPRSWQEDGRFGLALLAAVILVNLLVVLALSRGGQHTPVMSTTPAVTAEQASDDPSGAPYVHVLDDRALPVRE